MPGMHGSVAAVGSLQQSDLLIALGTRFDDRVTGQVPSNAIGTDAFQEADIRGITFPITKHNYLVTKADDIPRAIAEAFHLAATGRPGPV